MAALTIISHMCITVTIKITIRFLPRSPGDLWQQREVESACAKIPPPPWG